MLNKQSWELSISLVEIIINGKHFIVLYSCTHDRIQQRLRIEVQIMMIGVYIVYINEYSLYRWKTHEYTKRFKNKLNLIIPSNGVPPVKQDFFQQQDSYLISTVTSASCVILARKSFVYINHIICIHKP